MHAAQIQTFRHTLYFEVFMKLVGVFEYCVCVIFLMLLLESFTSPVIFSFHAYHSRFICHGLHHCVMWHCFEPLNQ